jgi:cytochrome P450
MAWQLARYQLAPIEFMEACAERYGNVFTVRMLGLGDVVVVTEPTDVRTILVSAPKRFTGEATVRVFEPIMGRSALMFTSDDEHRRQRQVLQPGFHRDLVERWHDQIATIVEAELAMLPTGRPVAMRGPMRRIAFEVICQLVFGIDQPGPQAQLRAAVADGLGPEVVLMSCFPTLWQRDGRLNPGRPLKRRRDVIHRLLLEQVISRRADPRRAGRYDALSLLVDARDETGAQLSDVELRDQLVGLLLAAHDTAAATLAWAVERVSRTPHAQARLALEVVDGRDSRWRSSTAARRISTQ